jgi:ring-1,2-phenylacetyl-CoA epoxidase subunit PaaB
MKSLDPRVNRLPEIKHSESIISKAPLYQFGTFEVFVEPKDGKLFQHEGAVHAPNIEMAFVLAKETFTRRFTCSALAIAETSSIYVSPITEGTQNVYDLIMKTVDADSGNELTFEIYYLLKRGKQHTYAGQVKAKSYLQAMIESRNQNPVDKVIYNVWAIKTQDMRFSTPEEKELWLTLPDKKFRDASDYKGGDKLKDFLERHKSAN